MRRFLLIFLLLAWPSRNAGAGAAPVFPAAPGMLCQQAIAAAEAAHAIPPHLLGAIGQVESGRRDPTNGQVLPWPWTVDADGQGRFFATKAQAIAAVRALQAEGVRSIDVGCLQVSLLHHPHAFANLDQAFDPAANADFAARFLRQLHDQTHDWRQAAAEYHSQTPALAAVYRQEVMQAWAAAGGPAFARGGASPSVMGAAPFAVSTVARGSLPATFRIIRSAPHGPAPTGRGLAAYRAAPIALASRPPPPANGGG